MGMGQVRTAAAVYDNAAPPSPARISHHPATTRAKPIVATRRRSSAEHTFFSVRNPSIVHHTSPHIAAARRRLARMIVPAVNSSSVRPIRPHSETVGMGSGHSTSSQVVPSP